jgi:hypothetical protein
MKKILLLLVLSVASSAHGAQFLKVTKSNSVIAYKEPTIHSKMLSVFAAGDEVEIVQLKDGWYKIKIPYQQGYFLMGWIPQNVGNVAFVNRAGSSKVTIAPSVPAPMVSQRAAEDAKPAKRSTGLDRSVGAELNRWNDQPQSYVKAFVGPVFDLHNYGAFQYRLGVGYEAPLTQQLRLAIPVSYTTGDGFSAILVGVEARYAYYMSIFSISPIIGLGAEYFFGNGKSFEAASGTAGVSFDFSITNGLTLGIEPFTAQAMVWNTTDSINKIPFNVRAMSLLTIRGAW